MHFAACVTSLCPATCGAYNSIFSPFSWYVAQWWVCQTFVDMATPYLPSCQGRYTQEDLKKSSNHAVSSWKEEGCYWCLV